MSPCPPIKMKSKLIIPALCAAVGIILRIVPIWAVPTWYDENFTILLARLPLDRLILATVGDVHPPLYYLLCWPLARIPNIPAWAIVRLPALVAGILAIWVWWEILQQLEISQPVRLLAFGLFCFLPQQIYYSQEGRMYSLFTLLVLCCWLCILRHEWMLLFASASAMLYTQNFGLIYAVCLFIAAAVYDRKKWFNAFGSFVLSGLLFLPWFLVMLTQMHSIQGNYWIDWFTIPSILMIFSHVVFAIGMLNANVINFLVFFGVLIWVGIYSIRNKLVNLPVVILAFLPIVITSIASLIWQPILLVRPLIPSGAFLMLFLAMPVDTLGRKPLLILAIFFLPALFVNIVSTAMRSHWADDTITNDAQAISLIDSQWQEGDLLYYANDGTFVSGSVSWQHIDNAILEQPCGPVRGSLSTLTRTELGMRVGPLPENFSGRIWVVTAETPLDTGCENDIEKAHGLLNSVPLYCPEQNDLVTSCVYLVEK